MLEKLAAHPTRTSLLTSLAALTVTLVFFVPGFETNDDTGMMLLASGALTGEPSPFLVFIALPLGALLALLYGFSTTVPWYLLMLLAAQWIAWAAILHTWLKRGPAHLALLFFLVAFAGFGVRQVVLLQFTSTAMLVASAGIAVLLHRGFGPGRTRPLVAAGALLLLASLVRSHSLLLALCIASPLLGLAFWSRRSWQGILRGGAVVLPALVAPLVDGAIYDSRDEWQLSQEYRPLWGAVYSAPPTEALSDPEERDFHRSLGWTPEERHLFVNWINADRQSFSSDRIRELLATAPKRASPGAYLRSRLGETSPVPAIVLCGTIVAFALTTRRRSELALRLGVILLPAIGVAAFLSSQLRLPARVLAPSLMLMMLLVLQEALANSGATPIRIRLKTWGTRATLALALMALLWTSMANVWLVSITNRDSQVAFRELAALLNERLVEPHPSAVIAGVFPLRTASPIDGVATIQTLPLVVTGWVTFSPHYFAMLSRYRIVNLFDAMADCPDVLLFAATSANEAFRRLMRSRGHPAKSALFIPFGERGGIFRATETDAQACARARTAR